MEDLDAVVQEKIEKDNDFQATLTDLSDEDKKQVINAKKSEVTKVVFKELADAKTKAEEIAKDQKGRAEKAEIELKKNKPAIDPTLNSDSSLKVEDFLELANEGITHKEDVELAQKWTSFNKKPMNEALKDPIFKTMLEQKREERKTAEATQTKGGPQGAKRETGEDLLVKANKGEFPQTEEGMDKMIKAKFDAKMKK